MDLHLKVLFSFCNFPSINSNLLLIEISKVVVMFRYGVGLRDLEYVNAE